MPWNKNTVNTSRNDSDEGAVVGGWVLPEFTEKSCAPALIIDYQYRAPNCLQLLRFGFSTMLRQVLAENGMLKPSA